jgi:hypothetical protein
VEADALRLRRLALHQTIALERAKSSVHWQKRFASQLPMELLSFTRLSEGLLVI